MLKAVKDRLFGRLLPQEFTLGFDDPQTEIVVWLHGKGPPIDVTYRYSVACAAPLTFCIGLGQHASPQGIAYSSLKFCRRVEQRLLGEVALKHAASLSLANSEFIFCEPGRSTNYCLPNHQLAALYFLFAYQRWRKDNTKGVHLSFLERRAMMVEFIRPHLAMLVSVGSRDEGNIFPMNLLGDLGNGYFGLALRTERVAGGLVERYGRLAISSIPLSRGAVAYQLAHNHSKPTFDWSHFPFGLKDSSLFKIPVPAFALRVREMELETVRTIGSHAFFLGRIVSDERYFDGAAFSSIHGFYQSWRLKQAGAEEAEAVLAVDALSKQGRYVPLGREQSRGV